MPNRKICPACNDHLVAIAYHRNGKTYYRNRCDRCLRQGRKIKTPVPNWIKSGYTKKPRCEKCGFVLKYPEQAEVYYLDGDVTNTNWANLRTICANCQIEVSHSALPWKPSGLPVDF